MTPPSLPTLLAIVLGFYMSWRFNDSSVIFLWAMDRKVERTCEREGEIERRVKMGCWGKFISVMYATVWVLRKIEGVWSKIV